LLPSNLMTGARPWYSSDHTLPFSIATNY
jgi:hypothetical protein